MITSSQNTSLKLVKKLKQRKHRHKEGAFVVEGERAIDEVIQQGGKIMVLLCREDYQGPFSEKALLVKEDLFSDLSETSHSQGILAVIKMEEKDFIKGKPILILDEVQDPGNLGTLLRSARAFGIPNVILGQGTVDLYNSKTLRSSLGSLLGLSIQQHVDLDQRLPALKAEGYQLFATDLRAEKAFDQVSYQEKTAFLLGNEGNGIRSSLMALCDIPVIIPMYGQMESLNVAVAGSLLMYEISKQLNQK